jgi:hypothetical protein
MTDGITLSADELTAGDVVAGGHFALSRDSLVRYAGASGDFNAIHYRDDVAAEVGLPGVLAHGMLTMGLAVQPVVDWIGDPGRVLDYQVRFTRPVLVEMITGRVFRIPDSSVRSNASQTVLSDIPMWDSPLMIADESAVPRTLIPLF